VNPLYTTTTLSASSLILQELRQAPPLTITLLAIGPLTNLALAFEEDPVIFSRAKRIVILGGAIAVPGNTTPYAEFNFLADPDAANIVLQTSTGFVPGTTGFASRLKACNEGRAAPIHVTLLPLDAADTAILPSSVFTNQLAILDTPLSHLTSHLLTYAFDVIHTQFKMESLAVYDVYAVSLVIDIARAEESSSTQDKTLAEAGWVMEYQNLLVETIGNYTRGMCCLDRRKGERITRWEKTNVEIVMKGDEDRFLARFVESVWDIIL